MIVLYFGIGFIVFAGATAILADRPDSIYIGVSAADCGEHEVRYLDMQELPKEFHSDVYMYSGPETPLYEFRGSYGSDYSSRPASHFTGFKGRQNRDHAF